MKLPALERWISRFNWAVRAERSEILWLVQVVYLLFDWQFAASIGLEALLLTSLCRANNETSKRASATDDEQFYMSLNRPAHRKWNMEHSFLSGFMCLPFVIVTNRKRVVSRKFRFSMSTSGSSADDVWRLIGINYRNVIEAAGFR